MSNEPYADVREMYLAHAMFRREFGLLPALIDGVSAADVARAQVIAQHFELIHTMLHHHHQAEDTYLWPRLLQRAGLRTVCLDSKLYAGGMASTVELFDGYHFEIAGSLQFPTSAKVSEELGLDDLPTVDSDVMSVSLRGIGDDPVIYYADPMKMLTHLNDVHGAEAVNGMAGLMAWSMGPTRALGRFEADLPQPLTIN